MADFKISLAAARVNTGLTQTEAAEKLGVTKQTIYCWENGHTEPTISQARQLSDLYGIPLDYIFLPEKTSNT